MNRIFKADSGVLITVISKYLQSHKRLVIPQLGAFIVKEPGCILFSELLKRDDGVLRGLLRAEGLNDLEGAGEIDRFVFEVRHAVEHGREYSIDGFGLMKPGPNDTIAFVYIPSVAAGSPAEPAGAGVPVQTAPSVQTAPASGADSAAAQPATPSAKLNPEPCLKGLRYGKPPKNTNAYTFVDKPPRRRRFDRFVLLALLAAAIAAAAIAYGYWREAAERRAAEVPAETAALRPADAARPETCAPQQTATNTPNPEQPIQDK